MLKGIDPLLSPDLLAHLRAMGHGDSLAIVDANFPAAACARRLVRLDGIPATQALDAVLSVLPLDHVDGPSAQHMAVTGSTDPAQPVFADFRASLARHDAAAAKDFCGIERFQFYEAAKTAYVVIATGERRLFGNILLRKGVIRSQL